MHQTRVFHIANEYGVDTNTVLEVLRGVGFRATRPEQALNAPVARKARASLAKRFPERAAALKRTSGEAELQPVVRERKSKREGRARKAPMSWSELQRERVKKTIPQIWAELTSTRSASDLHQVVVCHDRHRSNRPYEVITLDGERVDALTAPEQRRIVAPLEESHEWFRNKHKEPPNVYIVFDLDEGTAWFGKKLSSVQRTAGCPVYDVESLELVRGPSTPASGEPPKLAEKAHRESAQGALGLVEGVSDGRDRPEEVFLLQEDLLQLAVDSLDGADVIGSLPVHVNALWVFERPILMQRSDGSERYIRAVWFREGVAVWRIRAYVASRKKGVVQVGDQLSGRLPFVPVWDETHPEQKLIAAIWALMSQGDVSEHERVEPGWNGIGRPVREEDSGRGVNVVRIKAGTEHAAAYGRENSGTGSSPQGAFSVRGHWRQQPYPSLGLDEEGRVITKPVWIASYTKGADEGEPTEKVFLVKACGEPAGCRLSAPYEMCSNRRGNQLADERAGLEWIRVTKCPTQMTNSESAANNYSK